MNTKDLDHPAFPTRNEHYPNGQIEYGQNGMYLRQWYAGKAMEALIRLSNADMAEVIAEKAFKIAEAMIIEGRK